jgi:hypothetical protein
MGSGIVETNGMNPDDVSLNHPHDFFRYRQMPVRPGTCFVLMPFSEGFDIVFDAIREALQGLMVCTRADDLRLGKPILERILNGIATAELVIADLSGRNPNVFYELALAHTCTKNVLLLTQNIDDVPFDLRGYYCHIYKCTSQVHLGALREVVAKSAQEVAAKRLPTTLETAVIRTQRIVDAMNGRLRDPDGCRTLLIRIQAAISSLGNIGRLDSEDPDVRAYGRLLEDERELLIQLVEKGAHLRAILSPQRISSDPAERSIERDLRLDRVISFLKRTDECVTRCEFVLAPYPGANLLFIGDELLFEGHKTQVERGFGWTMVFTDKQHLEARKRIFDSLFESAREFTFRSHTHPNHAGVRPSLHEIVALTLDQAKTTAA